MRQWTLSSIITAFLVVGALSCGPAPSNGPSPGTVQWWNPSSRATSQDAFRSTSDELARVDYRCEAGDACMNSVALLLFGGPGVERFETGSGGSPLRLYELWNCTGVFISRDLILTNAHCIPKKQMLLGASLQGAGAGKLLDGRIFLLKSVVAIGKLTETFEKLDQNQSLDAIVAEDWAVVRVNFRQEHDFIVPQQEALFCADQASTETLSILAVDPVFEKKSGQNYLSTAVLRAKTCKLASKELGESPVFSGESCGALIQGNSGAPVFLRKQFFGIISMSPKAGVGIFVKTDQKLLGTIKDQDASAESNF